MEAINDTLGGVAASIGAIWLFKYDEMVPSKWEPVPAGHQRGPVPWAVVTGVDDDPPRPTPLRARQAEL